MQKVSSEIEGRGFLGGFMSDVTVAFLRQNCQKGSDYARRVTWYMIWPISMLEFLIKVKNKESFIFFSILS